MPERSIENIIDIFKKENMKRIKEGYIYDIQKDIWVNKFKFDKLNTKDKKKENELFTFI